MNKNMHNFLAGALATIPMTVAMLYLFEKLPKDEQYPLPPRIITSNSAEMIGASKFIDEDNMKRATYFNHFLFGAVAGVFYFPFIKKNKLPAVKSGMFYGLFVWGANYLIAMPALNLYPKATKDAARRNALMIFSHIIWGASLGLMAMSSDKPRSN